ncbi:MAG: hypothetical protein IJV84_07335 [Bacteroidales bacterium]|nr:hypothetical protein [Bacteroidales bacterium]MBQ9723315.1 hypothetical protein [Bacteroidales bacterium]
MKKLFLLSALTLSMSIAAVAQQTEAVQTEVNQYGQKVDSYPIEATVQDGILVFQNKNQNYKMWFDVRVQGDAAVFFGYDKNLTQIGNGMLMRRTRFAVKAQLDKNWYGELDTDWTSGTPEIKDAYIAFTGVKGLEIKLGNFKENFSIQRNTTSRYLQFMERPMVSYLAPSRHMGINVKYSMPALWVSAGAFGPELEGAETQTFIEDGNKDYGLNCGMSYTGKVVYRPLHKMKNASLHIGAAVSYRNPKTSSTDGYNAVRYSTRNTTSINRKKFLDTDAIKYLDHELAWTAELAGHWKGLRWEGAYIARLPYVDEQKYIDQNGEAPNFKPAWGWYAQAGYLLFGGSQNYDAGGAKYTRVNAGKEWGDIELCARVEYLNLNMSKYCMGGSAYAYSLGLNFHVTRNVKFVINWQYNDNDIYANGKGEQDGTDKTAKGPYRTGYDASGNVTYYPGDIAPDSKSKGIDYHMLACRFQVAF